jgi:hypothetical protein
MKISLSEITCRKALLVVVTQLSRRPALKTNILVLQMLEQLQLSISSLGEHRGAERLHDLFDGNILVGELIFGGAASRESLGPTQTDTAQGKSTIPDQAKSSHANRLQVRIPRGNLEGGPKNLGADKFSHCVACL